MILKILIFLTMAFGMLMKQRLSKLLEVSDQFFVFRQQLLISIMLFLPILYFKIVVLFLARSMLMLLVRFNINFNEIVFNSLCLGCFKDFLRSVLEVCESNNKVALLLYNCIDINIALCILGKLLRKTKENTLATTVNAELSVKYDNVNQNMISCFYV